jgi:hypothetical protein
LLVHLSLRGSRFNTLRFFLHLLEHVHCTDPSFLANIVPRPMETSLPQKKQLRKEEGALLKTFIHLQEFWRISLYLPGLSLGFA